MGPFRSPGSPCLIGSVAGAILAGLDVSGSERRPAADRPQPEARATERPSATCPRHDAKEFALRPKLLIVEDDAAMRTVWEVVFSQRGWDVILASTVAEGLAALDPPPDYLILDLRLPDGGGEVILRRVRDARLKTRVAVTTGSDDPAQLRLARSLAPEALFEKPINVADVWRESGPRQAR